MKKALSRFSLLMLPALFLVACNQTPKNDQDDQAGEEDSNYSDAIQEIDDMTADLNNMSGIERKTIDNYATESRSGRVDYSMVNGQVRMITSDTELNDESQNDKEWVYLDPNGNLRSYRKLTRMNSCDNGEMGPCVQEVKVYYDESGNAFTAFERTKMLSDSDNSLNMAGILFEETDYFDSYALSGTSAMKKYMSDLEMMEDMADEEEGSMDEETADKAPSENTGGGSKPEAEKPSKPESSGPKLNEERLPYNNAPAQIGGSISGKANQAYLVKVPANQSTKVSVSGSSANIRMLVYDRNNKMIGRPGQEAVVTVPYNGDIKVAVYLNGGDGSSDFNLRVEPAENSDM